MNARSLALGVVLAACVASAHAQQQKMPLPVEDDPNAPSAIRGQKAEPVPAESEAPGTPYSQAMAAYKNGDYDKAFDAIKAIDPTKQDDNFVLLEGHILTELKRYDDGEKLLRTRLDGPNKLDVEIALGDLLLHKRSYDRAAKYYTAALQAKPGEPDLTLKLIYARIGANDLRGAEQLASTLAPFNPKNPYDDNASYYFAHAALAQVQGRSQDAEDDIQSARTNYGITVTNRYLKTYLQFFSALNKSATDITPPRK